MDDLAQLSQLTAVTVDHRPPSQHSKAAIQHVAQEHHEWMIMPQGSQWLEEIHEMVDGHSYTHSSVWAQQSAMCPVCHKLFSAITTLDLTWPAPEAWHSHPFLVAIWYNDIPHIQRLLRDPSAMLQINDGPRHEDDRSPLYHAVRYGNADIIKLLLQARADPHKRSDYWTALG